MIMVLALSCKSLIFCSGVNQGDLLQEMKTMQNFLNERFDQQQERLDEQHERFQQELFNELQERFVRFDRAIADLKHKTPKSYTFAVIGQKEFDRLEDENLVFEMKPDKVKIKSMLLRMRLPSQLLLPRISERFYSTIIWSL
jgi:hypothetical protein